MVCHFLKTISISMCRFVLRSIRFLLQFLHSYFQYFWLKQSQTLVTEKKFFLQAIIAIVISLLAALAIAIDQSTRHEETLVYFFEYSCSIFSSTFNIFVALHLISAKKQKKNIQFLWSFKNLFSIQFTDNWAYVKKKLNK